MTMDLPSSPPPGARAPEVARHLLATAVRDQPANGKFLPAERLQRHHAGIPAGRQRAARRRGQEHAGKQVQKDEICRFIGDLPLRDLLPFDRLTFSRYHRHSVYLADCILVERYLAASAH